MPNDLSLPADKCLGVSARDRAYHCLVLAKDCSDDIRAHVETLKVLAWEVSPDPLLDVIGVPHPELTEMSKKGSARRKEVREERKMINSLRSQIARLLRDAQMYMVDWEREDTEELDEDESLDPMSRRLKEAQRKRQREAEMGKAKEIEASVQDAGLYGGE